jgi:hypothetical protein
MLNTQPSHDRDEDQESWQMEWKIDHYYSGTDYCEGVSPTVMSSVHTQP